MEAILQTIRIEMNIFGSVMIDYSTEPVVTNMAETEKWDEYHSFNDSYS